MPTEEVAREVSQGIFELLSRHVFPWYKSVVQEFELSPILAKILQCVAGKQGTNMRDLSSATNCPPSHLTGVIRKLEALGLVERHTASGDRRVTRVVLTEEGAVLNRRLEERLREPAPWMSTLSPADLRAFRDVLRKVVG